ncbi:acetyl-CoA carboxylase biotin carboxyl carrier protein [Aureibacillus halotolerans]|uniref:Biotin carboxyl carrier protein of acetyl-CoA carboxylase n=1 Tax=Aureibacillus halotolerans TaxID=1508390 RepID=A0A4R6U5A5_9BACI|nr:acetyl-CoA carboxylase biotin carboxyl carrier protein [Aureibacillus halotolerans]TDQ41648.1 biotin carboxyl carrier protein [Aureibacillus halotolerans]
MLNLKEIQELIHMLDQSSVDELDLENEGFRLQLKKSKVYTSEPVALPEVRASQPQVVREESSVDVEEEQPQTHLQEITSPMVGTFYASPSPDAKAYVQPGDTISSGKVVCILEAMKLFNEIESEVSGTIEKVLVENGQLVEYGQPLFLVKPE